MSAPTAIPRLSYDCAEAAKAVGLCRRSIELLVERGELPSIKPSGINRRLIKVVDLEAYIANHPYTPPSHPVAAASAAD